MKQMEQVIDVFDDQYIEPKAEEKAALIAKLQSGDFTLSFSSLSAFAISPAAFVAYKVAESKTTPAMLLGELVHVLVLEPDKIRERYQIAPNVDATTADGRNAWAKMYMDALDVDLEKNKAGNYVIPKLSDIIDHVKRETGVTIIPHKVFEAASFRARKLASNRACRHIIDQITFTEKSVEFDFCDLKFRGKIDGGGPGLIMDLKNVPDATYDKATGAIWGRRLHWQCFGYDSALNGGNTCYILAVDGNGETSVHAFHRTHLDAAQRQMMQVCYKFKSCITESLFDPEIWESSQDFWLRSSMNTHGINYL